MGIVDEDDFLTEEDHKRYEALLKRYGFKDYDFVIEVTEDQLPMDMNDLRYIVTLKVQVTHTKTQKNRLYESPAEGGTWLTEFEEDLDNEWFC